MNDNKRILIHDGDVHTEFPGFPVEAIPHLSPPPWQDGPHWQDKSWHNDDCPSWVASHTVPTEDGLREFLFVLWVRKPDPEPQLELEIFDVTDDPDWQRYYMGEYALSIGAKTVTGLVRGLMGTMAPEGEGLQLDREIEGAAIYGAAVVWVVGHMNVDMIRWTEKL